MGRTAGEIKMPKDSLKCSVNYILKAMMKTTPLLFEMTGK